VTGNLILVTGATATTLVTAAEVKNFCKVESTVTTDDTLFADIIGAAYLMCEQYTQRTILNATWEYWIDGVPVGRDDDDWKVRTGWPLTLSAPGSDRMSLPRPPLSSVTSIKHYNDSNTESTFAVASYLVDTAGTPGGVILNNGYTWPSDLRSRNSMKFTFVGGYGTTAASVPSAIKLAIMHTVAFLYEFRDAPMGAFATTSGQVPGQAQILLNPYKVLTL